jgi:hypothetical protein
MPVSGELDGVLARINQQYERAMREQDGAARQQMWTAEDGWVISYTTSRIVGGPHAGKFLTQAYRPVGEGARGGRGKAQEWVESYRRQFATRKAARARADALYRQHSPEWAARNPITQR